MSEERIVMYTGDCHTPLPQQQLAAHLTQRPVIVVGAGNAHLMRPPGGWTAALLQEMEMRESIVEPPLDVEYKEQTIPYFMQENPMLGFQSFNGSVIGRGWTLAPDGKHHRANKASKAKRKAQRAARRQNRSGK